MAGPQQMGLFFLGLASLIMGLMWVGQGTGMVKGSFMTGSFTWLAIGIVALIAGGYLIYRAQRKSR